MHVFSLNVDAVQTIVRHTLFVHYTYMNTLLLASFSFSLARVRQQNASVLKHLRHLMFLQDVINVIAQANYNSKLF